MANATYQWYVRPIMLCHVRTNHGTRTCTHHGMYTYVRRLYRRGVPRDPALCRPGTGTTPGLAAEAYAAVKAAKYADQDNFIPFILETGRWTCQQSGP
jgi:hypothetical protein